MYKAPAPGVTLLTEITRHKWRGKVVFPSRCVCLRSSQRWWQPGLGHLSQGSACFWACRAHCRQKHKIQWNREVITQLWVELSPLHSYPRKATLEQAWVPHISNCSTDRARKAPDQWAGEQSWIYGPLKPHHFYELQPALQGSWFLHPWPRGLGTAGRAKVCSCWGTGISLKITL